MHPALWWIGRHSAQLVETLPLLGCVAAGLLTARRCPLHAHLAVLVLGAEGEHDRLVRRAFPRVLHARPLDDLGRWREVGRARRPTAPRVDSTAAVLALALFAAGTRRVGAILIGRVARAPILGCLHRRLLATTATRGASLRQEHTEHTAREGIAALPPRRARMQRRQKNCRAATQRVPRRRGLAGCVAAGGRAQAQEVCCHSAARAVTLAAIRVQRLPRASRAVFGASRTALGDVPLPPAADSACAPPASEAEPVDTLPLLARPVCAIWLDRGIPVRAQDGTGTRVGQAVVSAQHLA